MKEFPNWFASAEPNFARFLSHYQDKPDLHFLQIGVFTGDASLWLLRNVITDRSSYLTDVDTWKGSPNEDIHMQMDFEDVMDMYTMKMRNYSNVIPMRMSSADFFKRTDPQQFDFIYIDGDHTAAATYADAVGAWGCLKNGGILAFDDYNWGNGLADQSLAPKPGIDKFLAEHEGEYTLLVKEGQVWIKRANI